MQKLFFDMDGVLVDFQSGIDKLSDDVKKEYEGRLDEVPGIFSLMDPMPGAIEAVHTLSEYYDMYILSTAPWKNTTAYSVLPGGCSVLPGGCREDIQPPGRTLQHIVTSWRG